MNVLVVGSGGREHALAWKLAQSPQAGEIHAAPGNPGIAGIGHCHPVRADDAEGLLGICRDAAIDLVVVGPEAPLVTGVADLLRHAGCPVFGPGADAARIEGSKSFAKEVMRAAGVATASALDEARAPCVLKADGLAAGKGVFVCHTQQEVAAALPRLAKLGGSYAVEELLEGEEVSLLVVTDGETLLALPPAQDFKRLHDGDQGPNTGGMGSWCPFPLADTEIEELVETVHRPVIEELRRRGAPFVGTLYAGLMLTADGPRVLEFNARFGDPETQAILPRVESDLLELAAAAAAGELSGTTLELSRQAAVTVVLASPGYPEQPQIGVPLRGLDRAEAEGALVFQSGTALRDGSLVSAGGRVLTVTALGDSFPQARQRAYAAVARIDFPGAYFRHDIAARSPHAVR